MRRRLLLGQIKRKKEKVVPPLKLPKPEVHDDDDWELKAVIELSKNTV